MAPYIKWVEKIPPGTLAPLRYHRENLKRKTNTPTKID